MADVQLGDLVLAKLGRWPYWPAIVAKREKFGGSKRAQWRRKTARGLLFWCVFYDEATANWVPAAHVRVFQPEDADFALIPTSAVYAAQRNALQTALRLRESRTAREDAAAIAHCQQRRTLLRPRRSARRCSARRCAAPPDAGSLVVVRRMHEPAWPAFACKYARISRLARQVRAVNVRFFDTGAAAWTPVRCVKPYKMLTGSERCGKEHPLFWRQHVALTAATRIQALRIAGGTTLSQLAVVLWCQQKVAFGHAVHLPRQAIIKTEEEEAS